MSRILLMARVLAEALSVFIVKVRRVVWQWLGSFPTTAQFTGVYPKEKCVLGVTLSGGEFTPGGHYGANYGYPSRESVDYYYSKGMRVIRLAFLWERVQPAPFGPLDAEEMSRIDFIAKYAMAKGMKVGIDVHNGGRGYGGLIGGPYTSDAVFADLWRRLAVHYHDQPNALFMLMSEPHDQSARQWIKSANAAIAAIRATGAAHTIVVPGSYFDGGWLWTISDNAKIVGEGVVDPLNNYMFEVHQYLDADASGGSAGVVSLTIGADRLADVTEWARRRGHRLFLGEFGAPRSPEGLEALDIMMTYIRENGDVWAYATWWGSGDRWYQDYVFVIEPVDYANPVDAPQIKVLQKYI